MGVTAPSTNWPPAAPDTFCACRTAGGVLVVVMFDPGQDGHTGRQAIRLDPSPPSVAALNSIHPSMLLTPKSERIHRSSCHGPVSAPQGRFQPFLTHPGHTRSPLMDRSPSTDRSCLCLPTCWSVVHACIHTSISISPARRPSIHSGCGGCGRRGWAGGRAGEGAD